MDAAERLRQDADDLRAMGAEGGIGRKEAELAELVLRLVADALDDEDDDEVAA